MQLLLKYEGPFTPESWREIGGKLLETGLWRFSAPTGEGLHDLLERIAAHSEQQVLRTTLAQVTHENDENAGSAALQQVLPFLALQARQASPWIEAGLEERLEMHFQPVIDLAGEGKVLGYEALCRARDAMENLLCGRELFALAQQAMRQECTDLACQALALQHKAHDMPAGMPLFLNVMATTLVHASWQQRFLRLLDELAIAPAEIVIEIAHSEQVDDHELAARCETLHARGVRIALDDCAKFGCLITLARVRADFIKIDRSLIHDAQGSQVRAVLVQAIVSQAERLGSRVIADGLERSEDLAFCQSQGIHLVQGNLFALPCRDMLHDPIVLPPAEDIQRSRSQERFRLADMVVPSESIGLHEPIDAARQLFEQKRFLPWLIVLDGKEPVGLLRRGKALSRAARSVGGACEAIGKTLNRNTPLSSLARSLYVGREHLEPWVMVAGDGSYLGVIEPLALVSELLTQREHGASLHPLSQLPTGPSLRQAIESRLTSRQTIELVYIDLDHFKSFNDRYGFIRGDAMIRTLAEILRHTFAALPDALLGHIGGDDFVLLLNEPWAGLAAELEEAMSQFHALASHLYDHSDLDRGYFLTEDGDRHPIASVSVSVVNGRSGELANSVAAAERAAQLKKVGKAEWGSVIVIEGTPPQVLPVKTMEDIGIWQQHALEALHGIAQQPRSQNPHALDAAFKAYPFFEMVFELDASGVQCFPNWINPAMYGRIRSGGSGIDRGHHPYFTQIAITKLPYVSGIYLSSASEDFCLTLSLPLLSESGKLAGALVADLNLSAMAALVDRDEK